MGEIRLLMVTTGLGLGGAEQQLVQLSLRFKQRGWQVAVVSMVPPSVYVDLLEEMGVQVYSLNMVKGFPDPRALLRLARIVRRFRPHVVHSHMIHANLLARITRILAPVPVLISTAHNTFETGRFFGNEASTHFVYRVTDWLTDATSQVSREGFERYLRGRAARADKLVYIPNGVDTNRFAPNSAIRVAKRRELALGEEEFVWLAVGRLEKAKDYPTLLRAFSLVIKVKQNARLLIAGKGSMLEEVERLIEELRLGERVLLLGSRGDVPELMNAADAYAMSSLWEGMPLVLLEAHASGLPIVATRVGDNVEIVREGVSGFLVPPGDVLALAGAMKRLMELTPLERKEMGLRGRRWVEERFSLDKVVEDWEALYLGLLRSKGLV